MESEYTAADYIRDGGKGEAAEAWARAVSHDIGAWQAWAASWGRRDAETLEPSRWAWCPVPVGYRLRDGLDTMAMARFLEAVGDATPEEQAAWWGDEPREYRRRMTERLDLILVAARQVLDTPEGRDWASLDALKYPEGGRLGGVGLEEWLAWSYWEAAEAMSDAPVRVGGNLRRSVGHFVKEDAKRLRKSLGLKAPAKSKESSTRAHNLSLDARLQETTVMEHEGTDADGAPMVWGSQHVTAGPGLTEDYELVIAGRPPKHTDFEEAKREVLARKGETALELGDGLVLEAVGDALEAHGNRIYNRRDGELVQPPEGKPDPRLIPITEIVDRLCGREGGPHAVHRNPAMVNDTYHAVRRMFMMWEIRIWGSRNLSKDKEDALAELGALHYANDPPASMSWRPLLGGTFYRDPDTEALYVRMLYMPARHIVARTWRQYRTVPMEATLAPNLERERMTPRAVALADALEQEVKVWKDGKIRQDQGLKTMALQSEILDALLRAAEAAHADGKSWGETVLELQDMASRWYGAKYGGEHWDANTMSLKRVRLFVAQDIINVAQWGVPEVLDVRYEQYRSKSSRFVVRVKALRAQKDLNRWRRGGDKLANRGANSYHQWCKFVPFSSPNARAIPTSLSPSPLSGAQEERERCARGGFRPRL